MISLMWLLNFRLSSTRIPRSRTVLNWDNGVLFSVNGKSNEWLKCEPIWNMAHTGQNNCWSMRGRFWKVWLKEGWELRKMVQIGIIQFPFNAGRSCYFHSSSAEWDILGNKERQVAGFCWFGESSSSVSSSSSSPSLLLLVLLKNNDGWHTADQMTRQWWMHQSSRNKRLIVRYKIEIQIFIPNDLSQ